MLGPTRASSGDRGAFERWPAGGALLAALLAAGCAGPPPLLVISGPTEVASVEVRDAEAILWRITTERPRRLSAIAYGVVPDGFRQAVPQQGLPPRPFVPGEDIVTETLTASRGFLHFGVADGPSSFEILASEMRLLEPLEPGAAESTRRRHRALLESLGKRLPPQEN